jgi:hypothetical protein
MTDQIKSTTPGPWLVNWHDVTIGGRTIKNAICVEKPPTPAHYNVIAVCGTEDAEEANTAKANAALISIAPEMLECLIAIQETALMDMENGCNGLHSEPINAMISAVLAKLANEAGEEI